VKVRSDRSLPDISVIIVVGDNRRRAQRAVDSVLGQDFDGRVEVLVIDLAVGDEAGWLENGDGRVRRMALPLSTTFGQARATAVDAARGPVVAFLEEHCAAMPGWIRALVRAHEGPWAGVGAEVHNANPGVGWSDALYSMGYSGWMPPAERGETALTATHNTSYKTDLLKRPGGIGAWGASGPSGPGGAGSSGSPIWCSCQSCPGGVWPGWCATTTTPGGDGWAGCWSCFPVSGCST